MPETPSVTRTPLERGGVRYELHGHVVAASRATLALWVQTDLKANVKRFVIDVEHALYLDGHAWRLFKSASEVIMRHEGTSLEFHGANDDQLILFQLTRLSNVFKVTRAAVSA